MKYDDAFDAFARPGWTTCPNRAVTLPNRLPEIVVTFLVRGPLHSKQGRWRTSGGELEVAHL